MTELNSKMREIIAECGPLTSQQLLAKVHEAGLAVTAESLMAVLEAERQSGAIELTQEMHTATFPMGYPRWVMVPPAAEARRVVRALLRDNGPMTAAMLMAALNDRGHELARETLQRWLHDDLAAGILGRAGSGTWTLAGARPVVLRWEKPPREESYEQWASYQADSAPPGTYAPNMPDEWKAAWKAKMLGQRSGELRVEIRKSTSIRRAGSVQFKIVVYETGEVLISANGVAGFSAQAYGELHQAVEEASAAMQAHRTAHPREETVAL